MDDVKIRLTTNRTLVLMARGLLSDEATVDITILINKLIAKAEMHERAALFDAKMLDTQSEQCNIDLSLKCRNIARQLRGHLCG